MCVYRYNAYMCLWEAHSRAQTAGASLHHLTVPGAPGGVPPSLRCRSHTAHRPTHAAQPDTTASDACAADAGAAQLRGHRSSGRTVHTWTDNVQASAERCGVMPVLTWRVPLSASLPLSSDPRSGLFEPGSVFPPPGDFPPGCNHKGCTTVPTRELWVSWRWRARSGSVAVLYWYTPLHRLWRWQ